MKRMIPKEELVAKQTGRHYGRVKARRVGVFRESIAKDYFYAVVLVHDGGDAV